CADWWYRKLWKMRCEWREEQLRAVCLVSKKASPYVSYEVVMHDKTTYKNGTDTITAQSNTDIQTAIGGGATGVTGADIKFKDGQ
ncbi:replication endonuclease, partial [Salmonella enterica subsp. enterica serovar Virginia]|nr:replication endonuclease [Salmonella enterica subsp. enterica serovar Virginia]